MPADMPHLKAIEDAADQLFIDRFRPSSWEAAGGPEERMEHGGWILVAVNDADFPGPSGGAANGGRSQPLGFIHILDPALALALTPSPNQGPSRRAHIEALAVHPIHARRGIGRALVAAALAEAKGEGYHEMSLRTYADVPWNGPFYTRLGFWEVDDKGEVTGDGEEVRAMREFYAACVEKERGMGLMVYGRRMVMLREI